MDLIWPGLDELWGYGHCVALEDIERKKLLGTCGLLSAGLIISALERMQFTPGILVLFYDLFPRRKWCCPFRLRLVMFLKFKTLHIQLESTSGIYLKYWIL